MVRKSWMTERRVVRFGLKKGSNCGRGGCSGGPPGGGSCSGKCSNPAQ
jgi:hypothetical protein